MLILRLASAQYNRATSVDTSNGKPTTWWSAEPNAPSTSIVVSLPLPTIYYNCYYAQSLCKNVELTQAGASAGTIDMELVYDKNTKRRDARRKKICPGNWTESTHAQRRINQMSGYTTVQEKVTSTMTALCQRRSRTSCNLGLGLSRKPTMARSLSGLTILSQMLLLGQVILSRQVASCIPAMNFPLRGWLICQLTTIL